MPRTEADLARRLLRMLVPAALAAGFVALYPAIAGDVVARLGRGFQPPLVAGYVTVLVGLFLVDGWIRDGRLEAARRRARDAEAAAAGQRQRAEDLRLVLEAAAALDGAERLEAGFAGALERLERALSFRLGLVYLAEREPPAGQESRGGGTGSLSRRGVWPLAAEVRPEHARFAAEAFAAFAAAPAGPVLRAFGAVGGDLQAAPIRERGRLSGVLVVEGAGTLDDPAEARLSAVADRLGAAAQGLRLFTELDAKERALRHAYRELKGAGGRLARAKAQEESLLLGRAASQALLPPVREGLDELRRLKRLAAASDDEPLREGLERVRRVLQTVRACAAELRTLRHLRRRILRPAELDVNDAVVAAVDLALPAFERARIDTRLHLDPAVAPVRVDAALLQRVLSRALRRARLSLRSRPPGAPPGRLEVETRALGKGIRITVRDDGLGAPLPTHRLRRRMPRSALQRSLELTERSVLAADLKDQGLRVRRTDDDGRGRCTTIRVTGVQERRKDAARRPSIGKPRAG